MPPGTLTRWMESPEMLESADTASRDPQAETLLLFESHGTAIYRFCRATLGNASDAEDVVQETFLKLLQHLGAGGDRSNLKSWLFTVAGNACRSRTRWRARWLPWTAEHDLRAADPPGEVPDYQRAGAAFAALAPRDRLLLSLRAHGLSYREMAKAAGLREASVGRLLARAVERWKRGVHS